YGDARLVSCGRHVEPVVIPAHRLLEPADTEVRGIARELDGLRQAPALVGIDQKDEVVTGRAARSTHPFGVLFRRAASNLELATGIAARPDLLHLAAEIG